MSLILRLARKLDTLAQYIARPNLFVLRRRGVTLDIYRKLDTPWLRGYNFATVLDVGANIGQFALAAHEVWPEARIYSFEPLPDCYEQMLVRLERVKAFAGFNVGLGGERGSLTFERSSFSPSSSFRKMASTHKTEFPFTRECERVSVKVERLDDVAAGLKLENPILLKIDVQGFEDQVLRGGEAMLRRVEMIVVESSFEVLYEGQPLFDDIYRGLTERGFIYKGALDQSLSPNDGRPLQADSIFVKRQGVVNAP